MDEEFNETTDSGSDLDDISDDIPEDVPEDIPEDIPEDVPEDIPEDVPDDIPEDVPEDAPEEAAKDTAEDTANDIPNDIPEDAPEDAAEDTAEDTANDIPSDIPEDAPEDAAEDTAEDTANDIPNDIPEDAPGDAPEDAAEDSPNSDLSEGEAENVPEDEAADDRDDATSDISDVEEDPDAPLGAPPSAEMQGLQNGEIKDVPTAAGSHDNADLEEQANNDVSSKPMNDAADDAEEKAALKPAAGVDPPDPPNSAAGGSPPPPPPPSTPHKIDEFELLKMGNSAINRRLEGQEQNYRNAGMSDAEIQDRLAADRWNFQKEFLDDAFPGQDISPNVFNGFREHGARDRIADIENSARLREILSPGETDLGEQPEDAAENAATDRSESQGDLKNYDHETGPETQDTANPETSGEFVSPENPYRERWEKFGDEFADDPKAAGWDSLKDVPFGGAKPVAADIPAQVPDTEDVASDTDENNSDIVKGQNLNPQKDIANAFEFADRNYERDTPHWQETANRYLDSLNREMSDINSDLPNEKDRVAAKQKEIFDYLGQIGQKGMTKEEAAKDAHFRDLQEEFSQANDNNKNLVQRQKQCQNKINDIEPFIDPDMKTTFRGMNGADFNDSYKDFITEPQGNAVKGFRGVCGINEGCSIVNQQTGSRLGEADGVKEFISNGWCITDSTEDRNGGTNEIGREKFLESKGLTFVRIEGFKDNQVGFSLDDIARKFNKGESAGLMLRAEDLQQPEIASREFSLSKSLSDNKSRYDANHATTIAGFSYLSNGKVAGVWLNDTGGHTGKGVNRVYIDAAKFDKMQRNTKGFAVEFSRKK